MVKDHSDSEKETRCLHMGYSFRLAARVLFYASSHRQDNTYHRDGAPTDRSGDYTQNIHNVCSSVFYLGMSQMLFHNFWTQTRVKTGHNMMAMLEPASDAN